MAPCKNHRGVGGEGNLTWEGGAGGQGEGYLGEGGGANFHTPMG